MCWFEKVKGHERAAIEKVSEAGYSSPFPCREVEGFLIDLKHRVMPGRSESSNR